jgi:two-component system, response regulator PdtaR
LVYSRLVQAPTRLCERSDRFGDATLLASLQYAASEGLRMKNVVLIVEDELFLRWDLADEFRKEGYVVLEAATANDAMTVCHDGMTVHILITDIQLNGSGSGWDVAKAFRAVWRNIPVVYTSGNSLDAKRSVPNGLFFAKPYHPAEIVTACRKLVASAN